MKRLGKVALGVLLACSLMPVPTRTALAEKPADRPDSESDAALALGAHVEHEAIAYVVDGGMQTFSLGSDPLESAVSLMSIDADAAAEAFERHAETSEAVTAARSISSRNAAETVAGRLVLVRDESKTAEQLIAELKSDPRVVFAEPNAIMKTDDESGAARERAALAELPKDPLITDDATRQTSENQPNGGGNGNNGGSGNEGDDSNNDNGNGDNGGNGGDKKDPSRIMFGEDKNEPATDLNRFVWGFANDGRMSGMDQADAVDMGYAAWNDPAAAANLDKVVVAVIDTGVDASNPDLAPVMWSEGLTSGIEQTGREDAHGFAVIGDASAGITSTTGLADYHGTHVAGLIGAAWDGAGISGLAGNVEIMAVRHDDTLSGMIESFDYVSRARDAGVNVRVANNSWGQGQGQWRSIDVAVTEIGRQGVVSVFAAGNEAFDTDTASDTVGLLAENPYVITVDAIDPTGSPSLFTQYGQTVTDVMAAGTTVLSTYATGLANLEGVAEGPHYLGEEDDEAALYENFDDKSHAAAGIDMQNFSAFTLDPDTIGTCEITEEGRRFDGEGALALPYEPNAAKTNNAVSGAVDLSALVEKPTYLSIRYTATAASTSIANTSTARTSIVPAADISVKTTDGWVLVATSDDGFGFDGGSWAGMSGRLPDNVDWEHFQVKICYVTIECSMVGGTLNLGARLPGTLVVDSIGLGSDPVPYAYMQGTSMACPAVAGGAAVMAGQGLDSVAENDPAKSAEKLAALVKGAAEPDDRYEDLCSTGGYATVDGAKNPGPAITEVIDSGGTVAVRGYFMPENSTVTFGGETATVTERTDLGDGKAELTVQKPEGFAGGQTTVRVEANGKQANHLADLGKRAGTTYYDQTDLPVPDELSTWGSWQLTGFDGNVYCLPRTTFYDFAMTYDHLLRYDPDEKTWEQVPIPPDLLHEIGFVGGVDDVSGATLDGALVLCLTDVMGTMAFVRYTADGSWEAIDFGFDSLGSALFSPTLGSDGKHLYLFGGTTGKQDSAIIYRIDLEAGAVEQAGELATGRIRPQVACGNGSFAVSGGISMDHQFSGVNGVETVTPQEGSSDALADANVPEGWLKGALVDFSAFVTETGQLAYAPGAVDGGFAFAGPTSDDGTADTYLLSSGDTPALTAYGKRASQQALITPAATAYRGQLYVLASSLNKPYRTFSATAMATGTQPGDADESHNPEPVPDPGTGAPDAPNADAPKALAPAGDRLVAAPMGIVALAAAAMLIASASRRRTRKA